MIKPQAKQHLPRDRTIGMILPRLRVVCTSRLKVPISHATLTPPHLEVVRSDHSPSTGDISFTQNMSLKHSNNYNAWARSIEPACNNITALRAEPHRRERTSFWLTCHPAPFKLNDRRCMFVKFQSKHCCQACPAKPCLKHAGRPTSMPICTWQITTSNRWKKKVMVRNLSSLYT